MTYKTHIISSVIIAEIILPLTPFIKDKHQILFYFIAVFFGSLFPDIDEPLSKISKMLPNFVTYFFNKLKHRGFTHNVFGIFTINIFFLMFFYIIINKYFIVCSIGFFIGYISHLFGDIVTYQGLVLIPGKKATRLGIFKHFLVGSRNESIIYLLFLIVQILIAIAFYLTYRYIT